MSLASKKGNLNEQVFHSLKDMIINGKLKPGEKLIEINLAKIFNTSRTPIRDALRRLDKENLVVLLPSQGAEVTNLSRKTIINLYECRSVLEGLAIKQAAEQIQPEEINLIEESIFLADKYHLNGNTEKTVEKNTFFHDKLIESSNNIPLIQMMDNIRTQILRYRTLTSTLGFRPTFIQEHTELLHAVKEKQIDLAELLMKQHILADLENFLQGIEDISYLDD